MAAAPVLNRPLWLEHADTRYPGLEGDLTVDVAVIGAGITGATAAYLLAHAGTTVALVESSRVCFGATGYTTAKLTVGHGLVYADLADAYGAETARRYARSNQDALERVAAIVEEHAIECDFERASNYVYAQSESTVGELRRELSAARAAGIEAHETTETDLPYPVAAAIRVDDQAQLHPWRYVAALVRLAAEAGAQVFELTRATHVRGGDPCVVEAGAGRVRARRVVVATQLPFLDRGLYFARAHPTTSYAIAAELRDDAAPRGMYISADQPTRSIRSTPAGEGRRFLIVGGEGHKPGAEPDTNRRYARLEAFARERFGIEAAAYRWSTHDYTPLDKLPYIGALRLGDDRVLVATGYAKWGMTKGTLAAAILADAVEGRRHAYADLYDSTRLHARQSATTFARENAFVAWRFAADRVRPRDGLDEIERLAPGDGTIARVGAGQYAVARDDDGRLHVRSARCTHLGCIVGWNGADRAWECPCHGSRFAADGTVVQGPATADLPPRVLPAPR